MEREEKQMNYNQSYTSQMMNINKRNEAKKKNPVDIKRKRVFMKEILAIQQRIRK